MAFMNWETPDDFFAELDREFHFTIDLAADAVNAKCQKYYTEEIDALSQKWEGICWLNPPYNRQMGEWMRKAYESAQTGATVICLIQGRSSDTKWWHDYVLQSSEIRYIHKSKHF